MRPPLTALMGLMVLLGGSTVSAQVVKSPAKLVPAKTLAYVELRQPAALAKEVAKLLEGSYLSDMPFSLAPLLAKHPQARRHGPEPGLIAGMLLAPEVLMEAGRLQGAAVAFTGLDPKEHHMPEFVVLIQPGDSHAPGFIMRMFAASQYGSRSSDGKTTKHSHSSFERVADVEGISVYRDVTRSWETTGDVKGPETVKVHGPALARLPNLFVVGSADLVKEVILRAKGKGKSPSLASLPAFQKAIKDFEAKPGLAGFFNPPPLVEMLEKADLGKGGHMAVEIVKAVVNPKAIVAVADQLVLENGGLHSRRRVYLNPKEKSPLLEVMPKTSFPRELLSYAPPDALLFAAMANEQGEQRYETLMKLCDSVAKIVGEREVPSQVMAKFEEGARLKLGKDVFGKIQGLGVTMPGLEQLMKKDGAGKEPPFALLVSASDAKTAEFLATGVVPRLFALMAGADATPTLKTVGGHKIFTLESKRHYTLNWGVHGSTLVVSPSAMAVVVALDTAKSGKGLLSDAKLATRIKSLPDPVAVGMVRPLTMGMGMYLLLASAAPPKPEKIEPKRDAERGDTSAREVRGPGDDKGLQQILEIMKVEQPLLLSVARTPEQITATADYPGLQPLLPRLINYLMEEAYRPRAGKDKS